MTVRIHLTAEDLTETRFAFSPVWETFESFRVLQTPDTRVFHLPWLRLHRDQLLQIDLSPMTALVRPRAGYMPDFLTPPPEGPYPDFEEELERIRATPHDRVALEVRRTYHDAELPEGARAFIDHPDASLGKLTTALRRYWKVGVRPHWPRLRTMLEGDVLFRARQLALHGAEALFAELHPSMSWADGVLSIDKPYDHDVKAEGRGLVLIPLAFACPKVSVIVDEPWQPTIAYPPRGIATLWGEDRPEGDQALAELVGETRAAILRALEIPMTTTEIAERLRITPGAVSQQLAQLRRAGVVEAHRSGRGVYSALTAVGTQLVGLLEP